INGSGKHVNWSLTDDEGNNLLNPGKTPQDNIQFLVFLVATVRAVYKHADILRASVGTYANDHRLGANEAPPAIISIFLGEQLTKILSNIENGQVSKATNGEIIDLGVSSLPLIARDDTDRNRTSPFAFTGNKFEFRAVGSSQSISFPSAVINTIVAESLDYLADRIKAKGLKNIRQAALEILQEEIKEIKPILFNGDNYTREWEEEAARRGLPNNKTTPVALKALVTDKALEVFEKYQVLSRVELCARYNIYVERYIKDLEIEAKCLNNIYLSQVLPAAASYQKLLAEAVIATNAALGNGNLQSAQTDILKKVVELINKAYTLNQEISAGLEEASGLHDEIEKADRLCSRIKPKMDELRTYIDGLEELVDDDGWPLPKFWEMLFVN
ncbi:MAG: glutamine synthetase type III, partial [Syntrophorhabdus sp.]